MKKNSTKLQLKAKTIRVLQDGEMAGIYGGGGGCPPSFDPRVCRVAVQLNEAAELLGGGAPPSFDPRVC